MVVTPGPKSTLASAATLVFPPALSVPAAPLAWRAPDSETLVATRAAETRGPPYRRVTFSASLLRGPPYA